MLLLAALWALRRELQTLTLDQLSSAVRAIPLSSIAAAVALTVLNYFIVTGYDQLAFVHLRRRFPPSQITVASFVGYAISNNVGFALLSGTSARYRFYSRWGLTAQEISSIIIFYSGTFWLGLLVLGGWSLFVISPAGLDSSISVWLRPVGALLLSIPAAYAIASVFWREPLRIGPVTTRLPRPRLVAVQFVLSILDWGLAVAALWVLLPWPRPSFAHVTAAFVGAQLLGLASHVPGGLGVFESLMVLLLKPEVTAAILLPALLVFRVIYYLLPLGVALVVLLADEFLQRRHVVARWGNAFGSLSRSIAPKVLAVFTFIAGAVLLFSGATPASAPRLRLIANILPLPVVEASHFLGSLLGLMLLLLSQGLARRLDAAYMLTTLALGAGIAASLFKGGDYEEALLLVVLLAVLVPARARFDRKATLFDRSFSRTWLFAVVAVVAASVWLGEFAFRHVQYTHELWWRFELDQDASRSLRAAVGVCIALLFVGIKQLLNPATPELVRPTADELAEAGGAILMQQATQPYLVYLRDKSLLWNDDHTAFIMYGVQRRTWVALGDPVGPPDLAADLVRGIL